MKSFRRSDQRLLGAMFVIVGLIFGASAAMAQLGPPTGTVLFMEASQTAANLSWHELGDPLEGTVYRVEWGTSQGIYSYSMEVGSAREAHIYPLTRGIPYYFRVVPHTLESEAVTASNEVSATLSLWKNETHVCGVISEDTTWSAEKSPYVLECSVTVASDSRPILTIEPGAEVQFRPADRDGKSVHLQIGWPTTTESGFYAIDPIDPGGIPSIEHPGGLMAIGSPSSPIIFTSTEESPRRGSWGSIRFGDQSRSDSAIINASIEFGGQDDGANIIVKGASPTIRNCRIGRAAAPHCETCIAAPGSTCAGATTHGSGILVDSTEAEASPFLESNLFYENADYDLKIYGPSEAALVSNTFTKAAWLDSVVRPRVHSNTFDSYSGMGLGCWDGNESERSCMLRIGAGAIGGLLNNSFSGSDSKSRIDVIPEVCNELGKPVAADRCRWPIPVSGTPASSGLQGTFSATTASLDWTSGAPTDSGLGYRVLWSTEPSHFNNVLSVDASTDAQLFSLEHGTTYYFMTVGNDSDGAWWSTNEVAGQLADATTLTSPPGEVPDTGFPTFGSFSSGSFDSINRQNLNLNFSIPIVTSAGRGSTLAHALVYDSSVWKKYGSSWLPANPTWGWKGASPVGQLTYTSVSDTCVNHVGNDVPYTEYSDYSYTDPSGTIHRFNVRVFTGGLGCHLGPHQATDVASDQSGYYLEVGSARAPRLYRRDGTRVVYDLDTQDDTMTDANGNQITKQIVSVSETHWIDSIGRVALKIITSETYTDYFTLDPNGLYQRTRLSYLPFDIQTNFGCAGVAEFSGRYSLPISLELPNGQSYTFEYENTPGYTGKKTARLSRVVLPTGGSYEYSHTGPNLGMNCSDGTVMSLTKTASDGANSNAWQFLRTAVGTDITTKETAPRLVYDTTGNETVFVYSGKRLTGVSVYQGAATAANLRSTTSIGYSENGTPSTRTTTLDNNKQAQVATEFDVYGNLLTLKEYDYGDGGPGPLVRTSDFEYLADASYVAKNLQNRVTRVTVHDGDSDGPVKSQVDMAYDTTPLECVTGAAQHDDVGFGCAFTTRGNLTSVIEYADPGMLAGGVTRSLTYDSLGNLRRADVDCCQAKEWVYSSATQWSQPDSEIRGPSGGPQLTQSFAYNAPTGLLETVTDENNKTTQYTYDLFRRPKTITRPDNKQILYDYNDVAHRWSVSTPIQNSDRAAQATIYDALGRPIEVIVSDATGTSRSITDLQYDALGRPYRTSNPHNSTAQYWLETRFDALGRMRQQIPPDGSAIANNWSYAYSGATVTTTDPAGKQMRYENDALGRLVKTTEPDTAHGDVLTQETVYSYDVRDLLTRVVSGAQARLYQYDGLGQLMYESTPERWCTSYEYNNFGLVTARTDNRVTVSTNPPGGGITHPPDIEAQTFAMSATCSGEVTHYAYDSLNRLRQVSYAPGALPATPTVTYAYGTNPNANNNGRLISITDGLGTETYPQYDDMGRPTQVVRTVDGNAYTIGYAYNDAGEFTSITYPSGRVVQQHYDMLGRLDRLSSGALNYLDEFTYDDATGQATAYKYANGIVANVAVSPARLQLQSLTYAPAQSPSSPLLNLGYGYTQPNGGNNGRITQITDNLQSGRTASYVYDGLNRLKAASTSGSASFPRWALSWTYDRYGNRLSQVATAGTPPTNTMVVDPASNHISSSGYEYDGNGNLARIGSRTFTYDGENRVLTYSGPGGNAAYLYDGKGLRLKKQVNGVSTTYLYAGADVIAEYVNGSLAKEYVYYGDSLLATHAGAALTFHLRDHLSARMTTDSSGHAIGEQGNYPFGENWYSSGTAGKWTFTSYERDSESSNDYAVLRYYDSASGRFLSPDILPGSLLSPASLNGYVYTLDDPVNYVDPLGAMYCLTSSDGRVYCGDSISVIGDPIVLDGHSGDWYGAGGEYTVCIDGICGPFADPRGSSRPGGGVGGGRGADKPSVVGCLARGFVVGVAGAVVVGAVAIAVVAAVPAAAAAVTGTLFVVGAVGIVGGAVSAIENGVNGNYTGLAFDIGGFAGAAVGGSAIGAPVADSLSPTGHATRGFSLSRALNDGWTPFHPEGASPVGALAKGPDVQAAIPATAGAGWGIAAALGRISGFIRGGC